MLSECSDICFLVVPQTCQANKTNMKKYDKHCKRPSERSHFGKSWRNDTCHLFFANAPNSQSFRIWKGLWSHFTFDCGRFILCLGMSVSQHLSFVLNSKLYSQEWNEMWLFTSDQWVYTAVPPWSSLIKAADTRQHTTHTCISVFSITGGLKRETGTVSPLRILALQKNQTQPSL